MKLEDIPIQIAWEDRGVPTAVSCDGWRGVLVTGLQFAIPFLSQPTVEEGAEVFGREFAEDLRFVMAKEANNMKGQA